MSQLLDNGVGFGLSIFTITGILKAFPYIIQVPGCNVFSFDVIPELIFGKTLSMNSKSLG